ncbi:hypothetical protein SAMN05444141_10353 [Pseudovibrio denitrificans]|uniref:Uncharacterized protein n=2 Tax=Pseudovibrio denitrificans TaxID=258256 RepID=A0A1I7AGU9_9HYPH|nr:hypothetical protein SAMN05444141_10353 [Pseudovibrio denitrificans]
MWRLVFFISFIGTMLVTNSAQAASTLEQIEEGTAHWHCSALAKIVANDEHEVHFQRGYAVLHTTLGELRRSPETVGEELSYYLAEYLDAPSLEFALGMIWESFTDKARRIVDGEGWVMLSPDQRKKIAADAYRVNFCQSLID